MSKEKNWKNEPLGRVADLIMGQSPESNFYSDEEIGLPFLQGCSEFGSRFPANAVYCSQPKKVAPKNSILFSVRAPVGQLNIADRDYIIGRGLAAIIGTRIDQRYLEQFLKFQESNFRNVSQGSTFEAINSSELSKWSIGSPSGRIEQTKIAEILSTVDQAIDQTESLVAKQQRIKTGLMQNLLTGNVAQGWVCKTLRDLATINYGKSPKEVLSADGLYPVVGTGGTERYGNGFLHDGESIILGRKGTIDRVHFVTGRFWAIDTAYFLSDFNDTTPRWLFYFLQNLDLRQLNEATGVPSLSRDLLYKIEVETPPPTEQTKIAEILSTVDYAINQTEALIAKQQRIKTGLMQNLLTGKVSVTPLLTEGEVGA